MGPWTRITWVTTRLSGAVSYQQGILKYKNSKARTTNYRNHSNSLHFETYGYYLPTEEEDSLLCSPSCSVVFNLYSWFKIQWFHLIVHLIDLSNNSLLVTLMCMIATDTPVLDFWWHLLWVSKPEWAVLLALGKGVHVIYSPRFTSGMTHANLLVGSMAAELISLMYLWAGIGGAWNQDLLCHRWMLYWLSYAGSAICTLFSHILTFDFLLKPPQLSTGLFFTTLHTNLQMHTITPRNIC